LVTRLENRGKDAIFSRLCDNYLTLLIQKFGDKGDFLEIGCGTGVVVRSLGRRQEFNGTIVGLDQSPDFIHKAKELTKEEQDSGKIKNDKIQYICGDAHTLESHLGNQQFDVIIAHTLISHVTDPKKVLASTFPLVKPNGVVVIFEGDYSSLSFAYQDDPAFGRTMDQAIVETTFAQSKVMRELPRLLRGTDWEITQALGDVVFELGKHASYFKGIFETFVPNVIKAGKVDKELGEKWMQDQREAIQDGTFFATCSYYTYFLERGRK